MSIKTLVFNKLEFLKRFITTLSSNRKTRQSTASFAGFQEPRFTWLNWITDELHRAWFAVTASCNQSIPLGLFLNANVSCLSAVWKCAVFSTCTAVTSPLAGRSLVSKKVVGKFERMVIIIIIIIIFVYLWRDRTHAITWTGIRIGSRVQHIM